MESLSKVRADTMTHNHDDTHHAISTLLVVPAGIYRFRSEE